MRQACLALRWHRLTWSSPISSRQGRPRPLSLQGTKAWRPSLETVRGHSRSAEVREGPHPRTQATAVPAAPSRLRGSGRPPGKGSAPCSPDWGHWGRSAGRGARLRVRQARLLLCPGPWQGGQRLSWPCGLQGPRLANARRFREGQRRPPWASCGGCQGSARLGALADSAPRHHGAALLNWPPCQARPTATAPVSEERVGGGVGDGTGRGGRSLPGPGEEPRLGALNLHGQDQRASEGGLGLCCVCLLLGPWPRPQLPPAALPRW